MEQEEVENMVGFEIFSLLKTVFWFSWKNYSLVCLFVYHGQTRLNSVAKDQAEDK